MEHFARIDENNIVVQIIVSNKSDIEGGAWGDPSVWKHVPEFRDRGAYAESGTFADIGYEWLPELNAFKGPQPHPLWVWNETALKWEPTQMWILQHPEYKP